MKTSTAFVSLLFVLTAATGATAQSESMQKYMNSLNLRVGEANRAAQEYHTRYGAGSADYSEISPEVRRTMQLTQGKIREYYNFAQRIQAGDPTVVRDLEDYARRMDAMSATLGGLNASARVSLEVQQTRQAQSYQRAGHEAFNSGVYYLKAGDPRRADAYFQQSKEYLRGAEKLVYGR